jgi:cell division protein ZapA
MTSVVVSIAGRTYRMSCAEGEEARLEALARIVEDKIVEMREGFSEIGEQRIVVMAAIAMADELADARSRVAALEAETGRLASALSEAEGATRDLEERAARVIGSVAERIGQISATLDRPVSRDEFP